MTTLPEFLLARITEDEAAAKAWTDRPETAEEWAMRDFDTEVDVHVERWSPARVLAECEAKRRIVEWHQNWPALVEEAPTFEQREAEGFDYARDDLSSMTVRMSRRIAWLTEREYVKRFGSEPPTGPVLRLLALPYADHPEYRDEWRPE